MKCCYLILELLKPLRHRIFELIDVEDERQTNGGTMQGSCGMHERNRCLKMSILSVDIANVEVFMVLAFTFLHEFVFIHVTEQMNMGADLEDSSANGWGNKGREFGLILTQLICNVSTSFGDFLDEKFTKWVIKVACVYEFTDHLQKRLYRSAEDLSEKVHSLKVGFTAHQNLV